MSRIEFCGGIGVGKSSLAAALAEACAVPLVSEQFEAIAYWRLFYDDPGRYALEKDLAFLLSHGDGLRAVTGPRVICDFAMIQTVAYSRIAGDAADTAAVAMVHARIAARLGLPRLIFRLRCATDVQLARIQVRGRAPEAAITRDYLERLDVAIDEQVATLPSNVRVVEVDTTRRSPSQLIASAEVAAAVEDWLH